MEDPKGNSYELIVDTLKNRTCLKQDVYNNTHEKFELFKSVVGSLIEELKEKFSGEERIRLDYKELNDFMFKMEIGSDVLVFHMHTNIFQFDRNHALWKTSYLEEDESNGYCGVITVYNFLYDSFRFNRNNDSGYLIARVFVNKENHFFAEGKRQLGFLFNDFVNSVIDEKEVKRIVESAILYSLNFDLYTPHYDMVKEISLMEIQEMQSNISLKTGKRLGFKFQADNDDLV